LKIIEDLIDVVKPIKIEDYIIGKHTILVESNTIGLASRLRDHQCVSDIDNMNLNELSKLALSNNLGIASVGMAAINSFFEPNYKKIEFINGYDYILNNGIRKKVGFVGHFSFIERLRKKMNDIVVFELKPRDQFDLDVKLMPEIIPTLDYLVITGTTLINHTFEDIIKFKNSKTKIMMLGPSTTTSEILFDYGVDIIAGTLVENKKEIIQNIKDGFGFKKQKGRKSYIFEK